MEFTVRNLNLFLLKNLPSAYFCGVRVAQLSSNNCVVTVKHKWFNQNPFRSMYFAVQNMGAELTTGALVMKAIKDSNKKVSMLVLSQKSQFTKKATGLITFKCEQGLLIQEKVNEALQSKEGISFWLQSVGYDEKGDKVGVYDFEWTLKVK
ncbi:DUF4442 domain-containing protein [Flavobacterium sp. xlx-214]|uniref:DUF4442 domain-containing protein n=1 Tax=unclassified Flavobacterium TaxID=196869 RepID=UPI0013D4041D|nr:MULTISPECIES: DUF4442 domain-containing protein [unclassified Flavobacterium]MBA5793761.1 DUF4442 domain-containing protein [Flavobacterium sp. xlx-221]QMI83218.1 DUF4442 domain-containing protein [Flavobacterium sp. xlx-214]